MIVASKLLLKLELERISAIVLIGSDGWSKERKSRLWIERMGKILAFSRAGANESSESAQPEILLRDCGALNGK
jgi:hypothetical protein